MTVTRAGGEPAVEDVDVDCEVEVDGADVVAGSPRASSCWSVLVPAFEATMQDQGE